MNNNVNLSLALIAFKEAAYNLNEQWQMLPPDNSGIDADYPFPNDFNELTMDIHTWVNTSLESLKNNG